MDVRIYRVAHYMNQFFAGEGGEESAGVGAHAKEGPVGPGWLLEEASAGQLKVAGTVICGDNRFVEDDGELDRIVSLIEGFQPDAVVAGPAFLAGRYGEACAEISKAVSERLSLPVVTGLAPEHPAVDRFRSAVPILRTGANASSMRTSMVKIASALLNTLSGIELTPEERTDFYKRGLIDNVLMDKTAAQRGVEMMLAKHGGHPWRTEIPIPTFETIQPAPPAEGKPLRLALITDGGLMLKGNPERMPSGRCTRYYKIGLESRTALDADWIEVNHFGYDTRYVAADPHRLVPLDAVRDLEQAGEVSLHPELYTLAGVATAVEAAAAIGKNIAKELRDAGIQAAILTST